MTNTEATTLLKRIADRRMMIHVNGTVMEAEPDEMQEALDLAIAALERDMWISVNERLPVGGDKSGAVCEDVWMLFDDGSVFCGWMNGCTDTAYYLDGYNDFVLKCPITRVMAWQPKPDPPKEEI